MEQFRQQANSSQADDTLEKWKNRVEKNVRKNDWEQNFRAKSL